MVNCDLKSLLAKRSIGVWTFAYVWAEHFFFFDVPLLLLFILLLLLFTIAVTIGVVLYYNGTAHHCVLSLFFTRFTTIIIIDLLP